MSDSENNGAGPVSEAYQRANQINARLSSRFDASLVTEGKQVAKTLIEHVRSNVDDYDAFVQRVDRSEEFSLHDSAQVAKTEKALKVLYVRAADLLETIAQSETRRSK